MFVNLSMSANTVTDRVALFTYAISTNCFLSPVAAADPAKLATSTNPLKGLEHS